MLNNYDEQDTLLGNGDILNALYDELDEQEVEELGIEIQDERFQITSEGQAFFFIRKLEETRRQRDKIVTTCQNEIDRHTRRVQAFCEKETRTLTNMENYFLTLLENYARAELSESKSKSLKTPYGVLSFKKSPDKYDYDEDALLATMKEKGYTQFVKTKESLNKKDLKAAIEVGEDGLPKLNGEYISGVTITPGEEKFSVK